MITSQIRGVVVPSITFFNKSYEITKELHILLNRHFLVNGADSICLFGVSGEGKIFSNFRNEKIKLLNITLESTGKKTPILLGVMGNNTGKIIDELEELGKKFDMINFIIPPPFLEKVKSVESFYSNIFDSINVNNPIYLYNNPKEFANNVINPSLIEKLLDYSNFSGIIDSVDNINFCKSYVKLINENFSFLCGKEENFQKFLQLIPLNLRKYTGIVPDISNLTNICSKLYYHALEDNLLDLHRIQDQLIDIRTKIYDLKTKRGKEQRGLKYAFLYLYRDIISKPIEAYNIVIPELERELDTITKGRIKAIVNYLINQKAIYQLYSLGKEEIYQLDDIINRFSNIEALIKQGKIKKIIGPYDASINTIYRVNFEKNQLLFRFRTIKTFEHEDIIKEKLLLPLLDLSLKSNLENFREKVKNIIATKKGEYLFNKNNPPIIPVSALIYYDETKKVIPYMFSVQEYLHGKSLKRFYEHYKKENLSFSKSKILNLFRDIGEILGKLHEIKFNSFFLNVRDLGKDTKISWSEIYKSNLEDSIQQAKKYNSILEKEIYDFVKDNFSLIEEEDEPVVIHNDFQWKNIIIKDDPTKLRISGIIDFDDWKIGVRAQDFVKIENTILSVIKSNEINEKFFEGYQKYHKIHNDFYKKIDLYSIPYYLREYAKAKENRINGDLYLAEVDKKINS